MPLRDIKVVEMMGLAPGPLCGMVLADFGAKVTVVQKVVPSPVDVMSNGKRLLPVDLKSKQGVNIVRKLSSSADVFLDTYRPGVMEKLGLGPELLMKENSRLIYARLSGYGQDGYYKDKAGHDVNYSAMSGVLSTFIKNKKLEIPPPFISDFAGGGLLCTLGIILALVARSKNGKGQIVDCSMTEGAAYVGTWLFKSRKLPIWSSEPGKHFFDGSLPFYTTYRTKDNKFMAVGALEPKFYSNFLKGLGLSGKDYDQIQDLDKCREKFQEIFSTKTQKEWDEIYENLDACVTPVLDISSVDKHRCNLSRNSFDKDLENMVYPNPAPKLSQTPGISVAKKTSPISGQHTVSILEELGYDKADIEHFIKNGYVLVNMKSNL